MSLLTVLDLQWATKCRRIVFFLYVLYIFMYIRLYGKATKWILSSTVCASEMSRWWPDAGWGRTKICPKIKEISQHESPPPPQHRRIAHTSADDLWHVYVPLTSPIATESSNNGADSWAPRKRGPWIFEQKKKRSKLFRKSTIIYLLLFECTLPIGFTNTYLSIWMVYPTWKYSFLYIQEGTAYRGDYFNCNRLIESGN